MDIFNFLTPASYWLLTLLWFSILILYFRYLRLNHKQSATLNILLIVLAIDAFRTLFESLFFGASHTAKAGMLPESINTFLMQPQYVFIPKLVNLIAAVLVLVLLLRHLLPAMIQERNLQKERIKLMEYEILERQKTEAMLKASEANYHDLFENAPDMYFTINKQGLINKVNNNCIKTLGYASEELLQHSVYKSIYAEDINKVEKTIQAIFDRKVHESTLEFRRVRKDESILWVQESFRLLKTNTEEPALAISSRDVTERKNMEDQLKYLIRHDSLTQLYNRNVFEQRMQEELDRARRYQHATSLLMLDIDYFKLVNDTYGHRAGDLVLVHLGKVLHDAVRKTDYAARYGGEEFMIILPETSKETAKTLANRLCLDISNTPVSLMNNQTVNITVSIGIATFPHHADTWRELVDAADKAMYLAKDSGRNQVKCAVEKIEVPQLKERL
jgi:diguanylate cyclase (GGDEF)-like protein/PAS domain S-box-containing protein